MKYKIEEALLGVAIGDALGVPVEFMKRDDIAKNPVTGMREFGVHNQPAGTWSDDTSLTLCLAESLCQGFNTEHMGKTFASWLYDRYWTARGKVFDIGNATRFALDRIASHHPAEGAGRADDQSQSNGSLMRIIPLVFYMRNRTTAERWDITRRVSSITHSHINCAIACFIYLEYARALLLDEKIKHHITSHYVRVAHEAGEFLKSLPHDLKPFERVLNGTIHTLDREDIKSSGYVIDTLEASLWCFLTAADFQHAVIKAVNLGDDTDTTGAVTGGLAGMYWGTFYAPKEWLECLARRWDIVDLAERLEKKLEL